MANAAASAVRARPFLPDAGHVAVGAGIAAGIGALGAADGGYFPAAWGWTALVALWLVIASILLGRAAVNGGALALVFVGGLTALAGWTWLSLLWTDNTVQTALEGFRMLAYGGVGACLVLLVRREAVTALLRGLLAAITLVSLYGLCTRLFPDRLGTYDMVSGYRLSEPLGYWNGLGIFATVGALLALAILARDRSVPVRAGAAAAFTVLLTTAFFTFSRGAWIALAIGIVAALALDPGRLQLALALVVAGAPAGLAVFAGSRADALTHQDSPLRAAADEGQEIAIIVALLAAAAVVLTLLLAAAERRVRPPQKVRLAFAAALVLVALGLAAAVLVRFGGPVGLVEEAHDAFVAPPPRATSEDLTKRLFTFTGSYRAEVWEKSWDQFTAHPVIGDGSGTYEQYWLQNRPLQHKVRDAHSLYLETLGELGVVGLVFLALVLIAPLAAALGARRHPLAAGAFGAYVAYLAHAGVDWDWELPALTIAALACGAALVVMRPSGHSGALGRSARIAAVATALAASAVAFVGLAGAAPLAAGDDAANANPSDWAEAEDQARKAERWAPWSSEPWQRLGEAQLGQGKEAEARLSFRKAIEREPGDWLLWFRLAESSTGEERRRALDEALRLNPLEPDVRALDEELRG